MAYEVYNDEFYIQSNIIQNNFIHKYIVKNENDCFDTFYVKYQDFINKSLADASRKR